MKKELASGKIELTQILARPPEFAMTVKVLELLLRLPRVGPVKARHMLAHCRIAHSKTLGGLSERQRTELIDLLRR
jgi:S13-like protein